LFLLGNAVAYVSLSRSMHYLLGLTPYGVGNYIQVDLYLSFVMTMLLAFGIALEVPLLRFVQKQLLDDLNADPGAQQQPTRQVAAGSTPLTPGERPPPDPNAT
jgi:Sec-independent protein translocase protein (TatC)